MSRLRPASNLARSWSGYLLYVLAVGAVATVSAAASARMTKTITAVAAQNGDNTPRLLSRVERHLLERTREAVRLPSPPPAEVVAMVRPAMHPADMASAMDRIESADVPVAAPGAARVAANRHVEVASCELAVCGNARLKGSEVHGSQVKGWRKSAKSKSPAVRTAALKLKQAAAKRRFAAASTPIAGKSLAGKLGLLPKSASANGKPEAPKFVAPADNLRLARTPGDIIRISLLGSS